MDRAVNPQKYYESHGFADPWESLAPEIQERWANSNPWASHTNTDGSVHDVNRETGDTRPHVHDHSFVGLWNNDDGTQLEMWQCASFSTVEGKQVANGKIGCGQLVHRAHQPAVT